MRLVACGFVVLVMLLSGSVAAAPEGAVDQRPLAAAARWRWPSQWPGNAVPGSLLVTAHTPAAVPRLLERLESLAGEVPGMGPAISLGGAVGRVRVAVGAEARLARVLRGLPAVRDVEPDWLARTAALPNDPWYDKQWAHRQAAVERAWDVSTGSPTARVAVIDTGMWGAHPDLAANVEQQVDISTGALAGPPRTGIDNDTCDAGHGNWVGGIAGAIGGNGIDVAGVSWRVSLLDIAVSSNREGAQCGSIPFSAIIAGVHYAVDNSLGPVDVVNLSLGSFLERCPTAMQSAIDRARAANVLLVAASANGETDPATAGRYSYPASCAGVLSVAATNRAEGRAVYSTRNDLVDLAAPGGDSQVGGIDGLVLTTAEHGAAGQVRRVQGTSFAAPYVSGVAALLVSTRPSATVAELEQALLGTARDLGAPGRDVEFGAGLVQADAAVRSLAVVPAPALPAPMPAPTPTAGPAPSPTPLPTTAAPLPTPSPSPSPTRSPSRTSGGGSGSGSTRPAPPPTLNPSPSSSPTPRDQQVAETPPVPPSVERASAGAGTTMAVTQAVAVSQRVFADGSAAHVVLARADDYADALAGSALGLGVGPVLFAERSSTLPAATRTEIARVLPRDRPVYLLGGAAALPAGVEADLRGLGYQVRRLSGPTREETAVAVADAVAERRAALGVPDHGTAILVTRHNWPDAVAAGPLGGTFGIPILLTPKDTLHPATDAALRRINPSTLYVIGGGGVVSEATAQAAGRAATATVRRLSGPSRDATGVAVGREVLRVIEAAGLRSARFAVAVNLRRADGYAHAISASALPAAASGVFVPVEEPGGTLLTPTVEQFVTSSLGQDGQIGVLAGDRDVLASGTADRLRTLLRAAWEARQ